jgi:hypothetical protein
MKALLFALMAAVAVLALSLPTGTLYAMSMTMDGYIIDTRCAENNKDNLDEFAPTHSKECALMPVCAESGYQFYSGGKLWKFDKASSDKVHEFLMKPDSTLHVSIEMAHGEGNMITLISVTNAN